MSAYGNPWKLECSCAFCVIVNMWQTYLQFYNITSDFLQLLIIDQSAFQSILTACIQEDLQIPVIICSPKQSLSTHAHQVSLIHPRERYNRRFCSVYFRPQIFEIEIRRSHSRQLLIRFHVFAAHSLLRSFQPVYRRRLQSRQYFLDAVIIIQPLEVLFCFAGRQCTIKYHQGSTLNGLRTCAIKTNFSNTAARAVLPSFTLTTSVMTQCIT